MVGGIDGAARARAKGLLRGLLDSAKGPRLRSAWRPVSARGLARAALGILAAAMVVVALAGVGIAYLMATGPINLESLKPRIAQSLEDKLGAGYRVSIGPTFLMSRRTGVALGFKDISIRDRDGRSVLVAPSGRVGLDAFALMAMQIKVRRLEFDGLNVKLRVRANGALSIAAGAQTDAAAIEIAPPQESAAGVVDLPQVVAALVDALAGKHQALDHVSLINGGLSVENEALEKTSNYKNLSVAFDKGGAVANITVAATGPGGPWRINARATAGGAPGLSIEARDLALDDLLLFDVKSPPFESDMPISFKVDVALTPSGAIDAMRAAFSLGAGYFKLADPDHEPFLVDEATGRIDWDVVNKRYRLDNFEALAGASHFQFTGWLGRGDGDAATWRGRLQSDALVFAGERPGEQAVVVNDFALEAHYLTDPTRLVVDSMRVRGPHLQADLSAEIAAATTGTTMKLAIQVGPSALADVLRMWPSFINPDARNWCLENLKSGTLTSGSMKLDWDAAAFDAAAHKRAVPADSVRGDFSVREGLVNLLPGVPPLAVSDVVGFITGGEFQVTAKRGAMEFAQGRRIQASDLFYRVPDTRPATIVAAQGGAHVQGGADALADLLARDAIKRFAGFSVDPANVKGQFQGQLTLDFSLGKTAKPEDQKFRAEGALSNFSLDKYVANERFEQGALEVSADSGNLKIAGQGLVNGFPAKVELIKGAADEGALQLALTVDDAARAKLGLNNGPALTGPMAVRVKAPLGKPGAEVEVDLTKVQIDSPEGAPLKAAGKPGKATFGMKANAESIAVTNLAVDAGSILARGSGQFGADGSMQNLKLTQLRFGPADDLKLDVQGGAFLKATVRGAAFDAHSIIKALLSRDPAAQGAKDIDIDAKIGNVIGLNKQSIRDFELALSRRGGALRGLQAKGQLGAGTLIAQKDESGLMSIQTSDAGAFARFLDVYAKMEGGALDLTLQDTPGASRGVVQIKHFELRNETALRRLTAAGPDPNRAANGGPIDLDAVHFDRLTADFTRSAGRLDVKEASISNPQIGLTTQGYIDYAHDRVDLNGAFVPVYQLNSLINGIPVVGTLLGGGRHEGIFGVNYRISGPASGPTLTVNPLSGITPGILRKIFGVVDGTTPPSTQGAAPESARPAGVR